MDLKRPRRRKKRKTVIFPAALLARVHEKLSGTPLSLYIQNLIGIDLRRKIVPPRRRGNDVPPPNPSPEE